MISTESVERKLGADGGEVDEVKPTSSAPVTPTADDTAATSSGDVTDPPASAASTVTPSPNSTATVSSGGGGPAPVSGRFVPNQAWLDAVKAELPLGTIMRLLKHLLPQVILCKEFVLVTITITATIAITATIVTYYCNSCCVDFFMRVLSYSSYHFLISFHMPCIICF